MRVLGIETSCDDTGIGLVSFHRGRPQVEVNLTASQALVHRKYGGVVPEVAAREHTVTILPTLAAAMHRGRVGWNDIDAIAVTAGPGLNTALLVGVETARTLAYVQRKPLVAVNHIEGHIASTLAAARGPAVRFPAVALVVSGGHTELILVRSIGRYTLLGQTVDDAVGEAFDKVAKILGLPYPGGPEIAARATSGNPQAIVFPRGVMKEKNLNFSYAGLKTSVLYYVQDHRPRTARQVADVCASFQAAAIEPLVEKTRRAVAQTKARAVLLAGGVAANALLRTSLAHMLATGFPSVVYAQAPLELCMDNGAMIALAGAFHARRKDFTPWPKLTADPNWELA